MVCCLWQVTQNQIAYVQLPLTVLCGWLLVTGEIARFISGAIGPVTQVFVPAGSVILAGFLTGIAYRMSEWFVWKILSFRVLKVPGRNTSARPWSGFYPFTALTEFATPVSIILILPGGACTSFDGFKLKSSQVASCFSLPVVVKVGLSRGWTPARLGLCNLFSVRRSVEVSNHHPATVLTSVNAYTFTGTSLSHKTAILFMTFNFPRPPVVIIFISAMLSVSAKISNTRMHDNTTKYKTLICSANLNGFFPVFKGSGLVFVIRTYFRTILIIL